MSKIDAATYRKMAELEDAAAAELIARHGTGVRPSWVSAALAIHWDRSDRYIAKARLLDILEREAG